MTPFGSLEVDHDLLASLRTRYANRPEKLEQVLANAASRDRLKAKALEPSPYGRDDERRPA